MALSYIYGSAAWLLNFLPKISLLSVLVALVLVGGGALYTMRQRVLARQHVRLRSMRVRASESEAEMASASDNNEETTENVFSDGASTSDDAYGGDASIHSPAMSVSALDTIGRAGRSASSMAAAAMRPMSHAASAVFPDLTTPTHSRSGRRLRRRERALILARRMMRLQPMPEPIRDRKIPDHLIDPRPEFPPASSTLPPELEALYKTVRIFGHFDKPVFFNLCKHMETIELREGEYLFRRGECDEYIHVVQSGQVDIYIRENVLAPGRGTENLSSPMYGQDKQYLGNECRVAEVKNGESIHSLLSVMDVLTGHVAPYKTVSARAVQHSKVIRLPVKLMKAEFQTNPDALIRLVQVIAMRLQRVTMFVLHNYLGLTTQLVNPDAKVELADIRKYKISKIKEILLRQKSSTRSGAASGQSPMIEQTTSLLLDTPQRSEHLDLHSSQSAGAHAHKKATRFSELETVVDPENEKVYNRHSRQAGGHVDDLAEVMQTAFSRDTATRRPSNMFSGVGGAGTPPFHHPEQDTRHDTTFEVREYINEEVLEMAREDIATRVFGLEQGSADLLERKVTLLKVPAHSVLTKEGDFNAALYFLVSGKLVAYQENENREFECIYEVLPGMITGQLAVLTGEPSMFKVVAKEECIVVRMLKSDLFTLLRDNTHEASTIILYLSHSITSRMSPFVRQIDFALDWMTLESGKVLFRQGDISDASYIVLNGRLRSVIKREKTKTIDAEYGRGDIIGLTENIRGGTRVSSVHAVRDTELARIPDGLLTMIRKKYPSVTTRIAGFLGAKLTKDFSRPIQDGEGQYGDLTNLLSNLSTVAIMPSNGECPLDEFSKQLEKSVEQVCSTMRLTSEKVKRKLGSAAFDHYEYQLTSFLGTMEEVHRLVLYQCDSTVTPWTRRCLRQADAVLVVARADSKPHVGDLEKALEHTVLGRSLKVLILLHPERTNRPTRTAEWLNLRTWLTTHFHLKAPDHFFGHKQRRARKKLEPQQKSMNQNDQYADFARLARFLTGTSIALVLGGGGARGISQIGILKVLLQAGIPIDIVGGTSIGSFSAALWAKYRDIGRVYHSMEKMCDGMSNIWNKIFDLTYPITSLFSANVFGGQISQVLSPDQQIEDLWIPYFAVSTNLATSRIRVHTNGSLWRYVRASMSLASYLPPMCDPKDGDMLMDGGYINNLPADVAKDMFGACKVIAVDVSYEEDFRGYYHFGDSLSGWSVLFSRWNPFATKLKVPEISDIHNRLSYISCHKHKEKICASDYCYHVRPPVQHYKTLAFDRFNELESIGRNHAMAVFTPKWVDDFINDLMDKVKATTESSKIFDVERNEFKDLVDVIYPKDQAGTFKGASPRDSPPVGGPSDLMTPRGSMSTLGVGKKCARALSPSQENVRRPTYSSEGNFRGSQESDSSHVMRKWQEFAPTPTSRHTHASADQSHGSGSDGRPRSSQHSSDRDQQRFKKSSSADAIAEMDNENVDNGMLLQELENAFGDETEKLLQDLERQIGEVPSVEDLEEEGAIKRNHSEGSIGIRNNTPLNFPRTASPDGNPMPPLLSRFDDVRQSTPRAGFHVGHSDDDSDSDVY